MPNGASDGFIWCCFSTREALIFQEKVPHRAGYKTLLSLYDPTKRKAALSREHIT
jgi:hypothetical protein